LERINILGLGINAAPDCLASFQRVLENIPALSLQVHGACIPAETCAADDQRVISDLLATAPAEVIVLCFGTLRSPDAKRVFDVIRRTAPDLPIVVLAPGAEVGDWRGLLDLQPDDFIIPPFRATDVLPRLWRLRRVREPQEDEFVRQLKEKLGLRQLVGQSPAFVAEIRKLPLVARCDASVLLTGETGTGKEMFARAVHFLSRRSGRAFMPVNCGAIPVDLVENELFGHAPEAYTSARSSRPGIVREADGGTLFLDEIDSLPPSAQVKLLRLLQEKEYRPLGAGATCRADVRVISAMNADPHASIAAGKLRQDLFYRLNVVRLHLPPLRQRPEDVPLLARHFLSKYAEQFGLAVRDFAPAALQQLMAYGWPGNVRELENVVERAVILCQGDVIRAREIELPAGSAEGAETESFSQQKARLISEFEQQYLRSVLTRFEGNIGQAARAAKKNRRVFFALMQKHRIRVERTPRRLDDKQANFVIVTVKISHGHLAP
jgi:DNA-binding NtrC family response regulator